MSERQKDFNATANANAEFGGAGGSHARGYGVDARGEPVPTSKASGTVGVTIQSYQERRRQ